MVTVEMNTRTSLFRLDKSFVRLEIAAKSDAAEGVVALSLRCPNGSDLPAWSPGAHIDVVLTPQITRQYSLCGDLAEPATWRIAVLREPFGRGGSRIIHEEVNVGDLITVGMPKNHFVLEQARKYLFIAGGIGITPIMAMAAEAARMGSSWKLIYGGRNRNSMAFVKELTHSYPDRVTIHPDDEFGLIDLDAVLNKPVADTLVYACGPEPLLNAVAEQCRSWPLRSLHVERFSARPTVDPPPCSSFEIELARSGQTVTVQPDQTVLDAVTGCGIDVPTSCEEGVCGTCETKVLMGAIDHRDSVLTDEEKDANNAMMVCVSRANCPKLVLDL